MKYQKPIGCTFSTQSIKVIRFGFYIITFFCIATIYGQFDYYSLEQGLSQANVRCTFQDRDGFIWLGTQDGLNRFDGFQFTKFRKELNNVNSLSGNFISSITEDKNGRLLIGTINGVTIYDSHLNLFERIEIVDSVNKIGSVSSVVCSLDSSIWIGDYYSGLIKIKENNVVRFMNEPGNPYSLSSNYVTSLCEDAEGNIWIGTFGAGLNKYNTISNKFEQVILNSENQVNSSPSVITSICDDKRGTLFVGTTNGLYAICLETNSISAYKENPSSKNSISGNNILSIYCDKTGKIWLAIEGKGVNIFDATKKKFTKIHIESKNIHSAEENNVISIFEDFNNNIWFGTSTNGLIKWKKSQSNFKSISKIISDNYLSNYSIRAIFVDKEKNTWIGTDSGLNKILAHSGYVKKYFHSKFDKTSINDNKVWAITEDKIGNIWIGTQRGLARYNKTMDNFERFIYTADTKESLPVFVIRSLHFDENNLLWFGTYGSGLYSFDIKKNFFFNHTFNIANPDAKKDVVIFQIYQNNDNKLWLVAASGLACYDTKTKYYERFFSDSQDDKKCDPSVVYSLLKDNDSTFWLGTLGDGLIKFNYVNKLYKFYTEKNGLSNNVVYATLKDNKENLWLATNYGIAKFDIKTEHFVNYDKNDGLPTDEFNTGAFFVDRTERFYFGGIEGMVIFNPESIISDTSNPSIVITNFKVFYEAIFPNKVYFDKEQINLTYYQNFFSFEFALLDLTSSPKNEYAYILEGYDKLWINSGKRRYAAYTDVGPGEYILKVKGANNDQYLNNKGMELKLIITPPFWMTYWFRFLTIGMILTSIIFVARSKLNKIKREKDIQQNFTKQLIQTQESERMRIASELHDSIGQNLVVIKNRAVLGIKNSSIQKQQIEEIMTLASDTISEVRGISYNLRPYQLGKIGLTKAIEAVIQSGIQSSTIKFETMIDNIDGSVPEENEIHLYRIIQECFSNALKHSNATNVSLKIKKRANEIKIYYSDNGKGFNANSERNSPSGFGFSSMKERLKLIDGTMVVKSKPGEGTKMNFNISINTGKIND